MRRAESTRECPLTYSRSGIPRYAVGADGSLLAAAWSTVGKTWGPYVPVIHP